MDESNDSENSNYLTAAVIQAATVTNVPRLKLLLERHPDLVNSVEPVSGNSLLHLAVLHGGYNSAVHLLNRGCNTLHRNGHGLTAVQLAQRLPERGAFAVAIQLTERKRRECQLAALRRASSSAETSLPPAVNANWANNGGALASLHQMTRRNLEAARGTVARLDAEVCAVKALVQSLEHQLILIESAAQLADLQQQGSRDNSRAAVSASGFDLEVVRCGVCLEIASSKIFQCKEGKLSTYFNCIRLTVVFHVQFAQTSSFTIHSLFEK